MKQLLKLNHKALLYLGLKKLQGSRLAHNLHWLEQHQFSPFADLRKIREQLLIQLLNEAYQFVPAYQQRLTDAGIVQAGDINLENFAQLSLLSRSDITFNGEAFTHRQTSGRGYYTFQTGGSTGTPVQLGQDKQYKDWFLAHHYFLNSWGGLTLGTPYFFLWAAFRDLAPQLTSWRKKMIQGYLHGRRVLNCSILSPEHFREFIDTLNRQQDCHQIIGYAYILYALACYSIEHHLPLNRPFTAVYATAENLTDRMRQTIQQVFQCPVYNRYGCREIHDIASECVHQNGMHINPLNAYVEVVDENGQPVPHGQEGEIVITSLHNYAMPLIRYRLGDRGIMQGPTRCACGREDEKIMKLCGRTAERLILPDGTWLGGALFQTAFDPLPHLMRHQIEQLAPDHLRIKLRSPVPDYITRYHGPLKKVTRRLQDWTGFNLKVEYLQTDAFERTPTGKELVFLQKMPPASENPGLNTDAAALVDARS